MFEIKHLKTLATLANTGNLRKAAEQLFTSQSALSHQIKELEKRLNAPLFIRNTSPVQFTEQGQVLLTLAEKILPEIAHANQQLKQGVNSPEKLLLAIACHACFQWLLPLTTQFSALYPKLDIEFIDQIFLNNDDKEQKKQPIDVLFTDEINHHEQYIYQEIGQFEVVAVFSKQNKLNQKNKNANISASDFNQQTLLTYPVKPEQLDIFNLFLNQHQQKPKSIKQVANSHVILQMVAANMGIATLPDWLVNSLSKQSLVQTKRIGEQGIFKTLYARYHSSNKQVKIIEQLIPKSKKAFEDLYQIT